MQTQVSYQISVDRRVFTERVSAPLRQFFDLLIFGDIDTIALMTKFWIHGKGVCSHA
jgi:hypothetical protein